MLDTDALAAKALPCDDWCGADKIRSGVHMERCLARSRPAASAAIREAVAEALEEAVEIAREGRICGDHLAGSCACVEVKIRALKPAAKESDDDTHTGS